MAGDQILLQCYNRGCGEKFNPNNNGEDTCRHHPGQPFFHDAYKGWSCCNKKCTDFTEFLNIKGCTLSKHSNIKPPEPEKPKQDIVPDVEVIEVKPIVPHSIERPPFDTPMTILTPNIAPSLQQQLNNIEQPPKDIVSNRNEIAIGTNCKNGGCTQCYQGPESNSSFCLHHPGIPIFHEGLKFWSCCQIKTTDFNTFLNQEGCKEGSHVWKKEEDGDTTKVQCRWDYHQTGPFMVMSVYAKEYSPSKSVIKINPIRVYINLIFPKQNNASFELDIELSGIVAIPECKATMYGTKVEIKLKKAEAGNWTKLERNIVKKGQMEEKEDKQQPITQRIEAVDLNDL
ncbi:hypothetical protein GWI33_013498 [Rhynchophorus ferrugineus]|uniref:Cysteine and histidine-rich domain-containing protein n=1 Tax=Rhynchophorus ferrugineus TaxID=354439 RepID=A0A834M6K5_RHYFE|nr:hypothetical protein GWI33_013498 [Rhynchophorus ferrugineus]